MVTVVGRDEADWFVRENSGTVFIETGYRAARWTDNMQLKEEKEEEDGVSLTTFECVATMWQLSNESVNVWSHVLAAMAFATLLPAHVARHAASYPALLHLNSSGLSMLAWGLFFAGCTFSFATSAGYHLFLFHSPGSFSFWVRLDLLGVTAGICASSFLGLSLAFHCFPVSFFFFFR